MPRLILESKDGTRREFALNGPRISVGRSDDNSIELADTLVSRRHAELVWDGGGYVFRENTHKALTHPHARESLGLRELRGRAKSIEVFRVLRARAEPADRD